MVDKFNSLTTKRKLLKKYSDDKNKIECFYCGHEFSKSYEGADFISVDHKISQNKVLSENLPVSLLTNINNLVISCKLCNSAKGKKELFNYINGEIIETNKGIDLREFKKERTRHGKHFNDYANFALFSSIDADEEWLVKDYYLNSLSEELLSYPKVCVQNIDIDKGLLRFKFNEVANFTYNYEFTALYIGKRFYDDNINYFSNKKFSHIRRKFYGLISPQNLACNIIDDITIPAEGSQDD